MTPARGRVLALLADGMVRGKSEAAHEAGVSAGVIDGLVDEGTLETLVLPPEPVAEKPEPDFAPPAFTADQKAAADAMQTNRRQGRLLRDAARRRHRLGQDRGLFRGGGRDDRHGRQTLILMPEIALTAQFLDRFAARFGVRPAEWHSELTPRRRARTWRAVADGEVSVVVGARSALFLPYADLGLIVVDEEHDGGLQTRRRRALSRPRHGGGARSRRTHSDRAVVGDAVARDRSQHAARPLSRLCAAGTVRRPAHAVGRSRSICASSAPPHGRFIAPTLAGAVQTAIERGEQALFFLNRRGYAPLTLCRACGFRFSCPNCDAWLVDHRFRKPLVCHHCGFAMPHPPHARTVRRRIRSLPSVPASSASKRKCACCFRRRGSWSSPAISSLPSSGCAHELDDVAQAASTSSSDAARRQGPSFSRSSTSSASSTPTSD